MKYMTVDNLWVLFITVMTVLACFAIVANAQLDTGNAILNDFFERDPDKQEATMENDDGFWYGFKIEHDNKWSYAHYEYGKDIDEAISNFIDHIQ